MAGRVIHRIAWTLAADTLVNIGVVGAALRAHLAYVGGFIVEGVIGAELLAFTSVAVVDLANLAFLAGLGAL